MTTVEPTAPASVKQLIAAARTRLRNLDVDEFAAEAERPGTVIVDVREPAERAATGVIPGAVVAPRGMLEFHADPATPYHLPELQPDKRIRLYCKSGDRSALAASALVAMGYTDVGHLDGGFDAWLSAGRPAAAR